MILHRRQMLGGLGIAAAAMLGYSRAEAAGARAPQRATLGFPRKSDFLIDADCTYLNGACTHPIPKVAMVAAREAAEGRGTLPPTVRGLSAGSAATRVHAGNSTGVNGTERDV